MIFMQSRQSRRFIGRLNPGDELITALKDTCRDNGIRCGEVRATGFLEDVVLEVFDHGQHRYRPLELGPVAYQLTSFIGNISMLDDQTVVHVHATLLPDLGTGESALVGGRLKEATVVALEFVLDTFDDFTLLRKLDEQTGFEQWVQLDLVGDRRSFLPAAARPAMASAAGRPPARVAVPDDAADDGGDDEDDEDGESFELQSGDILDHPRLKRCQVVSCDGERATIRLQSGRSAELHLSVISLTLQSTDPEGHRVFGVQIRRRT
jgi:hypothetical protein